MSGREKLYRSVGEKPGGKTAMPIVSSCASLML